MTGADDVHDPLVALLAEQRAYYRARAGEYDDWWLRRGAYDRGPDENARWQEDVAVVEERLARFELRGDVLELAAGTGLWTRHLAGRADRVTAVDASVETLAINRRRVTGEVDYVVADLFVWEPPRRFDVCFFGFWLSHVPSARFAAFWSLVDRALAPHGRVFLIDNRARPSGGPSTQTGAERARRRLSDGREFDIVKRWFRVQELERDLAELGWRFELDETPNGMFIVGSGSRSRP